MGFLELDGQQVKDDNFFQRMFWPSDRPGEVDTLGKQGLWVCWLIGLLAMFMLGMSGQIMMGAFLLLIYFLGGMGVREHSQPAAVLVAVMFGFDMIIGVVMGQPPGILVLIAEGLLIANVRATFLAAKYADAGGEELPTRFNETFLDKLVDQAPRAVWPKAKIPFFCLVAIYLLLALLGTVFMAVGGAKRVHPKAATTDSNSQSIEVSPSR